MNGSDDVADDVLTLLTRIDTLRRALDQMGGRVTREEFRELAGLVEEAEARALTILNRVSPLGPLSSHNE